jgi:hypothetical protein
MRLTHRSDRPDPVRAQALLRTVLSAVGESPDVAVGSARLLGLLCAEPKLNLRVLLWQWHTYACACACAPLRQRLTSPTYFVAFPCVVRALCASRARARARVCVLHE